jgi:hypothetical protein
MNRADVESFFKTLLLGDFEENQNTAAQVVGGLISLVPVLDQVMDARDITGALFNINKRGGFGGASADQLANLGFAAFGAVPEVGSAFKTVFKPMWKERRAAKGAVNGGLQAIESLLGMRKGGAIAWVRQELLGKWAARTNEAINAVDMALAACIELTAFVADASGWKDWLIPDPVQALAKELLPPLKGMQGAVAAALRRGSDEVREFLEDLLGEQAAAVAMAVGERAALASAAPGTRTKAGHNAAAAHPQGSVPARQPQQRVNGTPKADASKGAGPVHNAVQRTRKAFADLAAREKGLVGEHVADYHELERLGGHWAHDQASGQWSPGSVHKLNVDKRPINLSLQDLPKVNHAGIDAVWEHAGQYTVTEAKASESIAAAYGFGKYKQKKGWIPELSGLDPDHELLHFLLTDSSDKGGTQTPLMQMSTKWVEDRAKREGLSRVVTDAIELKRHSRRVVLVTFESAGAIEHAEALADIHLGKAIGEMRPHVDHGISRVWDGPAIDVVDKARNAAHEARRPSPAEAESTQPPVKRSKSRAR